MTTTTVTRRAVGKVRPADTRRHHRTLLLQHLMDHGPTTRADLARGTGLTRVTVSDLVAEMLQESLVDDIGARPGTHLGKPATLVAISESAPVMVAVDLSDDSGFDGAVVDLHGRVLLREQAPFSRGADAVDDVSALVARLVESAPRRVLGIGVGTPGIIDDEGVVLQAPNLAWDTVPLAATLAERHELPVCVGNDANIAAVAEGAFGDGDDAGLLMVTIGQGVGGGILVDGHPVAGPLRSAGEIGHIVVDPDGAPCACGNRGCLETLLSAPALRAAGSDEARSHAGDLLGSVLTPIVTTLGIADVVLHGPTELLDGPVLDAARAAVARQTLPFVAQRIRIRLVAHDELVLTGAAALVRHRELGVV
ncbi:ROK family transcriptional regulator [Aeromicrobium sp.]|uniref:ROK family transcriptional regulator n=1 Tax=Aeromicrobium sp. TaxID=1871063 RepID=UPI0028A97606|nr:ROK family transcriptional regulator [Aeromicrobium sp.]